MTSPLRGHPGAVRNDGAAGNYYAFGCVVCGAVPDGVVVSFFFFFTCLNPVPANVVKAINCYQGPGWGQPLEADRGFHGEIVNINLADDPTISHIGMDKSMKVQAEILREIVALRSKR